MNADMKWLDNPEVFRVNQLDAHSDHCYYMDYADMEKSENPLMQSLNGQWEFAFSKNVMDRPENFYEENFDASSFDKIMVPGHIELAGYDKIRYINTMYPWEGKEYHRGAYSMESTGDEAGMFSEAEYNPVGSYIKRFDLSGQMREKKICICFEGVEEAMYLWLNGQFVGYAEDSFTPSEFDLTPFIREKGNVLAVQVHKMSTAAFLEDQDFFRFFGIFRNVTLKAVPEVHLEDVWFQPTLNKDNISGRVSVKMKVSAPEGKKVSAHLVLKDRENNQVAEDNITLEEKAGSLVGVIDTEVGSVKAWDNYCPYLYHAYVELRGEDGEILEIIPYDIGFRRLEMIDKVIYLNGKRLVITGVNRHEWSAKTGRSISMDEMTAGAEKGIYEVSDLSLTPYLVPQECGMRMDTEWLEITRHTSLDNSRTDSSAQTLRIEKNDKAFAFSCLPYTASEIENATHHEELPPARRTVLCVYGAVRGVGGIDSWGSDVEDDYRISAEKDIHYSFIIR